MPSRVASRYGNCVSCGGKGYVSHIAVHGVCKKCYRNSLAKIPGTLENRTRERGASEGMKERKCLKCDASFKSYSPCVRICSTCKNMDEFKNPVTLY